MKRDKHYMKTYLLKLKIKKLIRKKKMSLKKCTLNIKNNINNKMDIFQKEKK